MKAKQQHTSLPDRPLTDADLCKLAKHESVIHVHAPKHRPEGIQSTTRGEFEGNVLEFWLEFDDRYQYLKWEFENGQMKWFRRPSVRFSDDFIGLYDQQIEEDFEVIE